MKENLTYIQITKDTRKLLQQIKLTKRESYDEIVNRLIKRGDTNERRSERKNIHQPGE